MVQENQRCCQVFWLSCNKLYDFPDEISCIKWNSRTSRHEVLSSLHELFPVFGKKTYCSSVIPYGNWQSIICWMFLWISPLAVLIYGKHSKNEIQQKKGESFTPQNKYGAAKSTTVGEMRKAYQL